MSEINKCRKSFKWKRVWEKLIFYNVLVLFLLGGNNANVIGENSFILLATITGEQPNDEFSVVAGVGDVNKDGFDDFIVGAPGFSLPGQPSIGRTYLYLGAAKLDTVPDLILTGERMYSMFGRSVAGAGDVNGDGFADILIGASGYGEYIPVQGKAYLYFGGAHLDSIPEFEVTGQGYYYGLGCVVAGLGDVNGDGYDDFGISAPNDDYDARGRAYIYFGADSFDSTCDIYLEGERGDFLGSSLSKAGDVNADGFDDVIIGAPGIAGEKPGKAYVLYGGEAMNNVPNLIMIGDSTEYGFANVVNGGGDFNGDSYNDVLVGYCAKITDEWPRPQNIKFYYGGLEMDDTPDLIFSEPVWMGNYGFESKFVGDLNNDGYTEILIGGVLDWVPPDTLNKLYLYLGHSLADTLFDASLQSMVNLDGFGCSFSQIGDVDNNGNKEIAVGALETAIHGPGHVYVFSYLLINHVSPSEDKNSFRINLHLYQNSPNPFKQNTTINFQTSFPGNFSVDIFNVFGQQVQNVFNGHLHHGLHTIIFNPSDLSGGIYLCRVKENQSGNSIKIKIIYLR